MDLSQTEKKETSTGNHTWRSGWKNVTDFREQVQEPDALSGSRTHDLGMHVLSWSEAVPRLKKKSIRIPCSGTYVWWNQYWIRTGNRGKDLASPRGVSGVERTLWFIKTRWWLPIPYHQGASWALRVCRVCIHGGYPLQYGHSWWIYLFTQSLVACILLPA